jgi:carboxyl-terminal processing protease
LLFAFTYKYVLRYKAMDEICEAKMNISGIKKIGLLAMMTTFIQISCFGAFGLSKKNVDDLNYLQYFNEIMRKVRDEYVEEVSERDLVQAALKGMLASLDPHSAFLTEDAATEMDKRIKGEFGGLGIEIVSDSDFIRVITPYEGTPAFKAGIETGDLITHIDGEDVRNLSLQEASERMRGKPKTSVKIHILRESTGEFKEYEITRDIISIPTVKGKVFDKHIAYLRLATFNEKSFRLMKKELEDLRKGHDIKGILLDLRWNPGGTFEQAVDISNYFLDGGKIVSIKGRSVEEQIFMARAKDHADGLPLVVLINSGSASASEIVAGALQDNNRAVIVGEKSFGKGSVQPVFFLADGAALKLTTALYYTPSGYSIQAEGVKPDVVVKAAKLEPIQESPLMRTESKLKKHLTTIDGLKKKDKKAMVSVMESDDIADYQLLRALDVVKTMYFLKSETEVDSEEMPEVKIQGKKT